MGKLRLDPSKTDTGIHPQAALEIRAGHLVTVVPSFASQIRKKQRKQRGDRTQGAQRACGGFETGHDGLPTWGFTPTCPIASAAPRIPQV